MFEPGAAEHSAGDHVEEGASQHGGRIQEDDHSAITATDLFTEDRDKDRALQDWLQERPDHPRLYNSRRDELLRQKRKRLS